MILNFVLADTIIRVKIEGNNITFSDVSTNYQTFVPLECLKLSVAGIIKDHPDLLGKSDVEIKKEGLKRFKEKIKGMGSEVEVKNYVVEELKPHGYVLKMIERPGYRPEIIK